MSVRNSFLVLAGSLGLLALSYANTAGEPGDGPVEGGTGCPT